MASQLVANASIIIAVSIMLAWLEGPLGLFTFIRGLTASGGLLAKLSKAEKWQELNAQLHKGQECPFCVGFWVGLIVTYPQSDSLYIWIYSALAAIGLAYVPICYLYFAKNGLFK